MKRLKGLLLLPLLFTLQFCSDADVGSKQRPFTMYFIPSVDAQKITSSGEKLTEFVSKYVSQKLYNEDTGFYVKGAVPTSYIAVVEAFGTNKADFATLTTFSYILAKDIKKYNLEASLLVIRGDGEKSYKGQIIARADSGINSLQDLKGKKFAYTDPASTSGFILPSKLLEHEGVDLGETVFAQKHDNVVTMVYQKQVDAGATYYSEPEKEVVDGKEIDVIKDARARVKTQFPDVEDKVKIIGFTQSIPNEPWVLRSNLYKDPAKNEQVKKLVIEAVMAFVNTQDGKTMLNDFATGTALEKANDELYADIRKIVTETDLDLEKLIGK